MAIDSLPATTDWGDLRAPTLEAIYLEHAGRLHGRLLGLTHDPTAAEDLASEAFLRLALVIDAGRTPDDPPAWLHRVATNLIVSRARRASVAARALPRLLEREAAESPEDEVITRERDVAVRNVVASLGRDDRTVVMLAARGYCPAEIAGIIGSSGPATRTRLCRARGRIRERLVRVGIGM